MITLIIEEEYRICFRYYNYKKKKDLKQIEKKINCLKNKGNMAQFYKIIEKIGEGCKGKDYKVYYYEETIQYRALKVVKKKTITFQDDDKEFLKDIEVFPQSNIQILSKYLNILKRKKVIS